MMYVLALTIWLSIGILYNIYWLGDYWNGELHLNKKFSKREVFAGFMFDAFLFPIVMIVNWYDRKYC